MSQVYTLPSGLKKDELMHRYKTQPKLLAACEVGRAYIEAQITGVPRPIGDLQEDKAQLDAAITEAKPQETEATKAQ